MKLATMALVMLASVAQADAQQSLGLIRDSTAGPSVKLEGGVVQPLKGGYLVYSIPPRDVKMLMEAVEFSEVHHDFLVVLEHLAGKARKTAEAIESAAVPLGPCILATNEVFTHRHKILNREVREVGVFRCLDHQGHLLSIPVYMGGPSNAELTSP